MRINWTPVVILGLISACGGGKALKQLKTTAALDLQCPAREVDVDRLSGDRTGATYRATGCGRTADYDVQKKGRPVRVTEVSVAMSPPIDAAPPPAVAPPPPPPPGMMMPPPPPMPVAGRTGSGAPAGAACRFSSDCSGGNCRMADGQNVCMGDGADGAPCWFASDCLARDCRAKRCVGGGGVATGLRRARSRDQRTTRSWSGQLRREVLHQQAGVHLRLARRVRPLRGPLRALQPGLHGVVEHVVHGQLRHQPNTRPDPSGCQRAPALDSSC